MLKLAPTTLIILIAGLGAFVTQAQGQVVYPVGFEWNRFADWTPRLPADQNTTNGNPDDDQVGQPVWKYEHAYLTSIYGGIGSVNPWYTVVNDPNSAFVVRDATWDSSWYGLPLPWEGWVPVDNWAPIAIQSLLMHYQNLYHLSVTWVRWINPGSCPDSVLRLTGQPRIVWGGPSNTSDVDVVAVLWRGGAQFEPLFLSTLSHPAQGNEIILDVDVPNITVHPGDSIIFSVRCREVGDNFYNNAFFYDDLSLTLESNALTLPQQPQDLVVCGSETATFTVPPPIPGEHQFEWRRNDVAMVNGPTGTGSIVSGAHESTLVISGCGADDAGPYDCVVTNGCGEVTSDAAELTVIFDDVSPTLVHNPMPGQPSNAPHSGFVDARAESTNGRLLNLGLDALTFVFDEPVYRIGGQAADATSFVVTSTGGTPPGIASVDASQNPVIRVAFSSPPPLREWTTVRAVVEDFCGNPIVNNGDLGPGALEPDRIDFLFLPGDVNQSKSVSPLDLVRFKQIVNGLYVPPQGTAGDYVDMNRSGGVSPLDLVRFKQLINGISPATQSWAGATANHSQP